MRLADDERDGFGLISTVPPDSYVIISSFGGLGSVKVPEQSKA